MTSDLTGAWLAQVYADPKIPAGDFRRAYALAQQTDAAGFIAAAAARQLTPSDADAEALAQLVEGGHSGTRRLRGGDQQ